MTIAFIVGAQIKKTQMPADSADLKKLTARDQGYLGVLDVGPEVDFVIAGLLLTMSDDLAVRMPEYNSYNALIAAGEYLEDNNLPARITEVKSYMVQVKA